MVLAYVGIAIQPGKKLLDLKPFFKTIGLKSKVGKKIMTLLIKEKKPNVY